jgi:hypothetical protein
LAGFPLRLLRASASWQFGLSSKRQQTRGSGALARPFFFASREDAVLCLQVLAHEPYRNGTASAAHSLSGERRDPVPQPFLTAKEISDQQNKAAAWLHVDATERLRQIKTH